jgi:pentatricopeptide repeat protein
VGALGSVSGEPSFPLYTSVMAVLADQGRHDEALAMLEVSMPLGAKSFLYGG